MKRALAILGALLVAAVGFLMPRLAAAYQEQRLAGDVRQMENAPVSLALAQDLTDLPELDMSQSLDLFFLASSAVELEEGLHLDAADAARATGVLQMILPADVYLETNSYGMEVLPDEAVPYLLSDMYGRSGVYWRCGWEGHPNDAVWVDDQHRSIVGFCLHITEVPFLPMDAELASMLSQFLYPEGGAPQVIWGSQDSVAFAINLEGSPTLTLFRTGGYYCLNIRSGGLFAPGTDAASASGEASGEADAVPP